MDFNQDTIAQLSQLDDDKLTALLAEQIAIKKQNGTLDEVEKMMRVIIPFLSPSQKARLSRIIQSIQSQNQED